MNRTYLIYSVILAALLVTAISNFYLAFQLFGDVSMRHLFEAQLTYSQLWVLDMVPLSFFLLSRIYFKYQSIASTPATGLLKCRYYGMFWGLSIYLVGVLSLIHFDRDQITLGLFIDYHRRNPIVYGLVAIVPFMYTLGYIVEMMFTSRYENYVKAGEIRDRNKELQAEIQDRKSREQELINMKKEALAAVKAKDHFLSNMSHEIRTPMNGIIGLVNLLGETQLNETQKKYINAIQFSSKNLLSLINQILDLSKINSDKLTLEHIDFNLKEVLRAPEDTFSAMAKEKGIVLRTLISNNVPQFANGDPTRLNQILMNLVGNAVKFTQEGGVDIIVDARSTDDGPRLSIQVNDTGIGIPKEKHGEIFESFTQSSLETARQFGGSGLGLAISKELVELFGGWIKVESEEHKGSCFMFEIQLGLAKTPQLAQTSVNPDELEGIDPAKVNILLAEDNKINQLVAETILSKMGFAVDIAENGQEVINMIYQKKYDVILMDVRMPLMSGLDAARFIRNATEPPMSELVIIALTASTMQQEIEKCYEVGMNDHLAKPFNPKSLASCLARHLRKKEVA